MARIAWADSGVRCALQRPTAAHRMPRQKIAPRWVLMPPVAFIIRASASTPSRLSVSNGASCSPAMAMRTK